MSTVHARFAASLSMVAIAITSSAQSQTEPPPQASKERTPLEAAPGAVRIQSESRVFQAFGVSPSTFREENERFRDPEQRAIIRAEQRAQILKSHGDVAELLQLDAATTSNLIDLLADLQTRNLEDFYASAAGRQPSQDPLLDPLTAHAEKETAKVQALRELLGQEKLERYQTFETLVNDYGQAVKLDARLDAAHKMSIEQKYRLAQVWHEQTQSDIYSARFPIRGRNPFATPLREMPSREALARESQLMTIASNEVIWRRMPKSHQEMQQRAAEFLTPPQLAALSSMNQEGADSLQKWITGARAQAGLSPEIPEQPEADGPIRTALTGDVKLAIKLMVNRGEATHYTDTVRNGGSVTFRCPEGLFVELRPTIYDDDSFDVRVLYFEPDSHGGRRLIGNGGQMGIVTRDNHPGGTGGTVIVGNRGYAIEMSAKVDPV